MDNPHQTNAPNAMAALSGLNVTVQYIQITEPSLKQILSKKSNK